ncbi:SMI1/KNR4 family protein [Flectobacillus roseus]|uniref:SMI1/KNR4 family protein n=1 Tax=Flectobacillus roseus TaxID=502259 RepID=A0ABT6Y3D6_9BACT|nr:SMI1/KNR4 family protein [Flectobacillus roseus]MDI9858057.1 SMI1/KNR4 family protein [Flectobacillus roseus]
MKEVEKLLKKAEIIQNDLVTNIKIASVEKIINTKIPEFYLNFLQKSNGFVTINSKKIFQEIPKNRIDYFGTFDSISNLSSNYNNLRTISEEFDISINTKDLLIIGTTMNGVASIAIGISETNKGHIYWLDGSDLDDIIFIKIADSLHEFIELL